MKKIYTTLLLLLSSVTCQAESIQVSTMQDVIKQFDNQNPKNDSKTLGVFDVDMVLVQPSNPAFQMPNMKRNSALCKRFMKDLSPEKQMLFLSLTTTSSDTILIDPLTPGLLASLQQRGIPLMALTSNLTGEFSTIKSMEQWRRITLRHLGIDFSKTAPYSKQLIFDDLAQFRNNYSTYNDGMLFVNGNTISKGDIFVSFLKKTQIAPIKVIFVDDRQENLQSVEAALQTNFPAIEYIGIHYIGAQKYTSKELSEAEFEAEWQKLADTAKEL